LRLLRVVRDRGWASGKFGHYAAPELPAGSLALRRLPATAALHRSCGFASRDLDAGP